jgi:VWFA-related protein
VKALLVVASVLLLVPSNQQPSFRAGISVVRVDADVRDGQSAVDGLTQDDFVVRDNGRPQKVLYFGHSDEPLDVVMLFDTSGSMMPAVRQVSDVARLALDTLRAGDRAAVMAFDADTVLVSDFTSDFAAVDSAIRTGVLTRPPRPNIQIQFSVAEAARHFRTQPPSNRRRVVLVVTDNMGLKKDKDAVAEFWESDAVLAGVVVPGLASMRRQRKMTPIGWFGIGGIDDIVSRTGGEKLKVENAGEGFQEVMRRLRQRYMLHYEMPAARPGERRHLEVSLTAAAATRHRGARVTARSGYIVPGASAR